MSNNSHSGPGNPFDPNNQPPASSPAGGQFGAQPQPHQQGPYEQSSHGQAPYGQPSYGQGQQYGQPYQQPAPGAYGQQHYTDPAYGRAPMMPGQYTSWGKRVASALVDLLLTLPVGIIAWFFQPEFQIDETTGRMTQSGGNMAVVWLLNLVSIAIVVWNQGYRQGKTGQSIGKQVVGTKLIEERTGQPLGFGKAVLRQIVHFVDGVACFVGYLWPLWDAKRQTFADKIMTSVVVDAPKH